MSLGKSTRSVHGGRDRRQHGLALPIHPASVYAFETLDDEIATFEGKPGPLYSRFDHPTGSAVETHLAELEGTEAALLFSSGMAAITNTILSVCTRFSQLSALFASPSRW